MAFALQNRGGGQLSYWAKVLQGQRPWGKGPKYWEARDQGVKDQWTNDLEPEQSLYYNNSSPFSASVSFLILLIFTGTNTTSHTVYCLFAILANKPEIQEKMACQILEEIGSRQPRLSDRKTLVYIEAAILEVLRYSSIAPLNLPHCTTVDTTINGFDVPKDTGVNNFVG